jgi:hypothetical protein
VNILSLLVCTLCLTAFSCAPSQQQLQQEYDRGRESARFEYEENEKIWQENLDWLERDLAQKNERLAKFNQLNADKTLRNANPCFDTPEDEQCQEKVTGKEDWQK